MILNEFNIKIFKKKKIYIYFFFLCFFFFFFFWGMKLLYKNYIYNLITVIGIVKPSFLIVFILS